MSARRPGQDPHHVGDQDLPAVGGGAQPRRLDHRRAVDVAAVEGDVTGRHADPDGQRNRGLSGADEPVDRLLDGHRRRHRVGRSGERGHDPVAEAFDDAAVVGRHGLSEKAVMGAAQFLGRVFAQPAPQFS